MSVNEEYKEVEGMGLKSPTFKYAVCRCNISRDPIYVTQILRGYGEDGWKLISILHYNDNKEFYFMRQTQAKEITS